jgi:large subunit ribosomal protein L9
MKVILRQDVEKLGEKGTVQNVSDGFARNYLIPQGLAILATPGELRHLDELRQVQDRKILKQEQQLQSLADRINGMTLTFVARAGEQGRLYGSVTAGDIAERLSASLKHEIDRRKVVLDEPIRQVGEHTVVVNLVGRLRPQVKVIVEGPEGSETHAEGDAQVETATESPVEEAASVEA